MQNNRNFEFDIKHFHLNGLNLGIATDIGPRILYLYTKDKPEINLFGILPDVGEKTDAGFWKIFGGHRLWSAPEEKTRTYSLDNKPVKLEVKRDRITIISNPEFNNSLQKEITIQTIPSEHQILVIHTIKNIGIKPIQLACWAISVMKINGFAIIPFKPFNNPNKLLADRKIVLWPYSKLSDERLIMTDEYIFVKQIPNSKHPFKMGTIPNPSWIAYYVDGMAFIKKLNCENGTYPDMGCGVEIYTNDKMLELESLGPLKNIEPNKSIHHDEIWQVLNVGILTPDVKSIHHKLEKLIN